MNTLINKVGIYTIDSFISSFTSDIVTRKYIAEIDEDGDESAPFGKDIIISRVITPNSNLYDNLIILKKVHKQIINKETIKL